MKYLCLFSVLFFISCGSLPIVEEVLSPDTFVLTDGTVVRYAGVKSLDKRNPWYSFSRDANTYLLQNRKVKIIIEPKLSDDKVKTAYVYTPIQEGDKQKWLFANGEMVNFGLIEALQVEKIAKYPELWEQLWLFQEKAKTNKMAIWGNKKPEDYEKHLSYIKSVSKARIIKDK